MTQHWTDFAGQTTGLAPSGWTARWVTSGQTITVEEPAGLVSGKAIRIVATTTARRCLSWDEVENVADVEVVARLRTVNGALDGSSGVVARIGGAAGSETGVVAQQSNEGAKRLRLLRYTDGAVESTSQDWSWVNNEWYWIRLNLSGTSMRVRRWKDGTTEPATWNIDTTVANPSSVGLVGLAGLRAIDTFEFDVFGVGTAGDPAPTEDPSNGGGDPDPDPDPDPPGAAVSVSGSTATVTWDASTNLDVFQYEVERGTSDGEGGMTGAAVVGTVAAGGDLQFVDSDLDPGEYGWQVFGIFPDES